MSKTGKMRAGDRTRNMTCPVCGALVVARERVASGSSKARDFVLPKHGPGPSPRFEAECPASNKTTKSAQAINNLGIQKRY